MLAYIAKAEGSVSQTVVVDGRNIGNEPNTIIPILREINETIGTREELITKFAVIKPSIHPMYDLNYFFFQLIPGDPCQFEYTGSCGHSILASIHVAIKWGWLPNANPGLRVRVFIENIGDSLVCEIDQADKYSINCTAHFIDMNKTLLRNLLLTGNVTDIIHTDIGSFEISLVSTGNPYVFVNAKDLGYFSKNELFQAGNDLYLKMEKIRNAASKLLGWNPKSVFPKIAAISDYGNGNITVRAISVPKWHPTIALTGATCLGVAGVIEETIVNKLVKSAGMSNNLINIDTPSGNTSVICATTGRSLKDSLLYTSISNKRVDLIEPINLIKGETSSWKQSILV